MFTHGFSRAHTSALRRVRTTHHRLEALERRDLLAADLVRDINEFRSDGDLSAHISPVVAFNGAGYFVESALGRGTNLFRTNGTQTGTELVKQLNTDVLDVNINTAVANGQLFFTAPASSGRLLWRTDGTTSGTQALATMGEGDIFAANNRLYFNGTSDSTGSELWISDGTQVGTRLLADISAGPASSVLRNFAAVGTKVVFTISGQYEAPYALETLTSQVQSLGANLRLESPFVSVGSQVFFGAAADGVSGQLWRSDGTPTGTYPYLDAIPGEDEFATVLAVSGTTAIVGSWASSQSIISQIDSNGLQTLITKADSSIVSSSQVVNNQVLVAFTNGNGTALWHLALGSQTTATPVVASITLLPHLNEATLWNNAWYFPASDSLEDAIHTDLWKVDLSQSSLSAVKLDDGSSLGTARKPVIAADGLYWADQSEFEPSKLRRTANGSAIDSLDESFATPTGVNFVTNVNGRIVFAGQNADGQALRSVTSQDLNDLSPQLTLQTLSPLQQGPTLGSLLNGTQSTRFGNRTYFVANDTSSNLAIWRTDGTAAGTIKISDQFVSPFDTKFAANNNGVFFVTRTNSGDVGLFRVNDPLDGSSLPGIELVKVLPFSYTSIEFVGFGDRLLLSGNNLFLPVHLVSDGTDAGTVPLNVPPDVTFINAPVVVGSEVFFNVFRASGTKAIWKTDGTNAGTMEMLAGQTNGWTQAITDGTSVFWYNAFGGNLYRSDDRLATQTVIANASLSSMAAQGGALVYTSQVDQNRTAVYRTFGSIGQPELLTIAQNPVNLQPVPGGILLGSTESTGYRQRLIATGNH